MECPSCYEIYNEKERVPRNLNCGHTYCESCLFQIMQVKKECPSCRQQMDPLKGPKSLSKNYIALNLIQQMNQSQQKLNQIEQCQLHQETIRYYCKTDKMMLCPSCIIDHSGHQFIKYENSGICIIQNHIISSFISYP